MSRPILFVLAGPNGAGKSTLYESRVALMTSAEFVNADQLARERFGHPAGTEEESRWGQQEAERRREALMREGKSLVVESTFSHPSKVELIEQARRRGYMVVLFHVNVESADDAVRRVASRVARGGHPVPEARIRGRYVRNQALIRQAVLMADRAYIFDNSALGKPPRLLAEFSTGMGQCREAQLPEWAESLYGAEQEPLAAAIRILGHPQSPSQESERGRIPRRSGRRDGCRY